MAMKQNEKDYLFRRLSDEANKAKTAYLKASPLGHTPEVVRAALVAAGFIVPPYDVLVNRYWGEDGTTGYKGITLPDTPEIIANREKGQAFITKVDAALQDSRDAIYLGDPDAAAILANFKASLTELAR